MTKKFYLSLLAALLCLCGSTKAETVEEDFDFSVTCNDGDWAASGISQYCNLVGGKGTKNQEPVLNSGTMRIYGTNTLTFTVKEEGWTLKSITFNGVSNPTLSASEGTMDGNVWTGSTATVTFTNTGSSQVKPTGIHVVYEKPAAVQEVQEDWDLSGTVSQAQPSWSAVDPAISQYVTIVGARGTGSQDPSLGSTRLRLFSGNTLTITVKETSTSLKSLAFTFYSSTQTPKDNTEWTVSAGTFDYENGTWSAGDADVKELVITNTKSSQLSFTAVKAAYTAASGEQAVLAKPVFSPVGKAVGKDISSSDIVDDELTIEISAAEGASIYYTLDGTTPTTESTLYAGSIVLRNSAIVSAIAVKGEQATDVVAYRYFIHKHDAEAMYYESFDGTAYWGGNDGDFNPNMQYSSSTLVLDNADATYTGCVATEQSMFMNNGTFQTAPFALPVKEGTLTLRAAGRITGATTINLSISSGTLSLQSVTAKAGEWTDYTIQINNAASGAYIQLDGTGFVDEIKVIRADVAITSETVTIGETGYATYVNDVALNFSGVEGLTAQIVNGEAYVEKEVDGPADPFGNPTKVMEKQYYVLLEDVAAVPAGTPFILKGEPGRTYEIPAIANPDELEWPTLANLLEGTTTGFTVDSRSIYVLRDGDEGMGFYYAKTNDVVAPHRAYLPAANTESTADFIPLVKPNDVTTAIREVGGLTAKAVRYNLNGQRISNTQKGIQIVDGKKTIVK